MVTGLLGGRSRESNPVTVAERRPGKQEKMVRPRPRAKVEQSSEFFVSNLARLAYSEPPILRVCSAGRPVPGLL
jgi:hypothetical protein